MFEFSPYGEILRDEIHDNAVAPFALRFSTKWRDTETGWLNYGRRYYDPRNGRFIGRDPIAEEGGINLYAFCGNNPVKRWDRLGMHPDIEIYEGEFYCPDDPYGDIQSLKDNDVTGPYGTDPSQYFGTYVVTSTMDGSSGSASWIGVDGTLSFETFESPFYAPIEVPVPYDAYYDDEFTDDGFDPNLGGQAPKSADPRKNSDVSALGTINNPKVGTKVTINGYGTLTVTKSDTVLAPAEEGAPQGVVKTRLGMSFTPSNGRPATDFAWVQWITDDAYGQTDGVRPCGLGLTDEN